MKKYLGVALGVLTAIGGFVDIGDLVTNAAVGSRFGLSLAWVVRSASSASGVRRDVGRGSAVSGRPTFDIVVSGSDHAWAWSTSSARWR